MSVLWLALVASTAGAQVNVLTANYDNARTNSNLNETILNHANVNSGQFGKLFTLSVDGQVYAQPLYVGGVKLTGGTHNVVYVATMHNTVYAFDADPAAAHDPLWQVHLGPSVPTANYSLPGDPYADIQPENGVLSTPVIDLATSTLYAVAANFDGSKYSYVLHALDITSGQEKNGGPEVIQANGVVAFDPYQHLQRPGLLLSGGVVYAAFGSHGDQGDQGVYHGWIMGYDAANVRHQVGVFNVTPSGRSGSIWQAGHGLMADELGAIYAVTANGDFNGVNNFGETVLKLAPPALSVADWFTPNNYAALNDADWDLGSCGPLLLPGTNLLLAGGKSGQLYLLDRTRMGHVAFGDSQAVQSFPAVLWGIYDMALWNRSDGPVVYLQGFSEPLTAYRFSGSQFDTTPLSQGQATVVFAYGGLAISASGSDDSTGILWVTWPNSDGEGGPGSLHAMDATNLATELWNSDLDPNDHLGDFAKFVAPTVAGGLVYVPTFSGQVAVYGLKSAGRHALGAISVENAASYGGGAVSPDELVAIFGSGIGPATAAGFAGGDLPDELGGVSVQFDGQPAQLVYASSWQIIAIVPPALSPGSATAIQLAYQGQTSGTVTLPVNQVTPGLYSMDQSGSGQGVILNADMSLNVAGNPAPRGSVIQLYATGLGPLTTLSATVGGQPATVTGATPDLDLAGAVIAVSVLVPLNAPTGSAVPLALSVAGVSSQTVTVALQ